MRWLVKEEPTSYSFERLERDGRVVWSGVRNPLAQIHLKSIKKGDQVFYYHTGNEKAVVGLARAATGPTPDPTDRSGRRVAVELSPVRRLARPVTLAEIKARREFAAHPLVRIGRLSVMPVSEKEARLIDRLSERPAIAGRRA